MNTLSRADTAQLFDNPSNYGALQRHWSRLVQSERRHTLTGAHHLVYVALLGRDWRKGFAPLRNPRKLANGGLYTSGLFRAVSGIRDSGAAEWLLEPFEGLVTPAMLQRLRTRLPDMWLFVSKPEAFAGGAFPFEAYLTPAGEVSPRA